MAPKGDPFERGLSKPLAQTVRTKPVRAEVSEPSAHANPFGLRYRSPARKPIYRIVPAESRQPVPVVVAAAAVVAARRLHSDAPSGGRAPNSLRELRSLRSDKRPRVR